MKKLLGIVVLGLFWCNILPAKTLNIQNQMTLDVPSSHKYIKYDNEEIRETIEEMVDVMEDLEIKIFLVGPNKYVDLEKAILDGEDPMDNEFVQSIVKKLERKNFQDEVKAGKWMISEAKKIMKKEKIDFITYAIVVNKTLLEMSSEDDEVVSMLNELQSMNNSELIKQTNKIKKEISTLDGFNKQSYSVGPTSFTYNKLKIGKNKNGNLFLKGPSKMYMAINDFLTIDAMLNFYLGENNNKTYLFVSVCYVGCSKFNSKFDKMIKPIISTNTQVQKTTSNISDSGDLIEQLEALNELYKSGVLTKEEFEKAKKKIFN